jgi:bis(5'-nucleosidyl)-tetraphosphatase
MAHESSYGILPLRMDGGSWRILLIQHRAAGYWGFPKGHAEGNEEPKAAAVRELKEETNLEVVRFLSEAIFEENYHFSLHGKRIEKTVWFFVAEVAGSVKLQSFEVANSKWVLLSEAVNHLTHETDKSICTRAIALIDSFAV